VRREGGAVLHEELDRLPDRFRLALIACYLEGKTQGEASRELGRSAETAGVGYRQRDCSLPEQSVIVENDFPPTWGYESPKDRWADLG
jgi:Sigma-70, region 4